MTDETNHGPLTGLRVLDMSRVLAGPTATQILGDMGAEVLKIENPAGGDDTRGWGPPFLAYEHGEQSRESAYYLCANRNKRSLALDIRTPEGEEKLRALAAKADVLIENFKPGGLAKYGLAYADMKTINPRLIYLSLTGFGQTGPLSPRPGYDFMIQAMGGIMSLTGEPEGMPMKTGVAIADLMTGMYATTAILAALHHRHASGHGQYIDLALFDTQLSWLANAGQYYLTSGEVTPRMGNAHTTIVPYQVFETADGHMVLAVGNDSQFAHFCDIAGRPELAQDPDYATNDMRVRHRGRLVPIIEDIMRGQDNAAWATALEKAKIPFSPINDMAAVFAHPQTAARDMRITMTHPMGNQEIDLIGSPLKFSDTPVTYRHAPPRLNEGGEDLAAQWLED